MFLSVKMEKYMESKVSDIFQLKLVTENIVLGFREPSLMFFSEEAYKCLEPDC